MRSPLLIHGAGPRVLVIAGHDPSGGAGVLADAASLRAAGAVGELVVTAWTRQDDRAVLETGAREPAEWLAEARGSLQRARPAAIKLGLLPGAEHVRAAAALVLEARELEPELPVVVDPVVGSSSGHEFVDAVGRAAYLEQLAPLGLVWTPNLLELGSLLRGGQSPGEEPSPGRELPPGEDWPLGEERRLELAGRLLALGARSVVVKGGHGGEDPVRELVREQQGEVWIEHPRVPGAGIRGSGCRHASTMAAHLAGGASVIEAARAGADHVRRLIAGQG